MCEKVNFTIPQQRGLLLWMEMREFEDISIDWEKLSLCCWWRGKIIWWIIFKTLIKKIADYSPPPLHRSSPLSIEHSLHYGEYVEEMFEKCFIFIQWEPECSLCGDFDEIEIFPVYQCDVRCYERCRWKINRIEGGDFENETWRLKKYLLIVGVKLN